MTFQAREEKPQAQQILEYLEAGNEIDALTALAKFKCFRLAARIKEIRQLKGDDYIETIDKVLLNGKKIGSYRKNPALVTSYGH